VLKEIIVAKDSTINFKDSIIGVYHKNENRYEQTISLKDTIISRRNNEIINLKKDIKKAYGAGILGLLIGFLSIIF
jgi:hypothetical protein